MRSGLVKEAVALAVKIGLAIKSYTSAELSPVDVLSDPHGIWSKVRQLAGRGKLSYALTHNSVFTADQLNDYNVQLSHMMLSTMRQRLRVQANTILSWFP